MQEFARQVRTCWSLLELGLRSGHFRRISKRLVVFVGFYFFKQGRPSSEAMMHFPSVSDFPLFSKNFLTPWTNFPHLTFSRNYFRFSSAKLSAISIPFPLFRENYSFPSTFRSSPCFRQFHMILTYFMCFSFPLCFHHDAFMHHTMHVGYWKSLFSSQKLSGRTGSPRHVSTNEVTTVTGSTHSTHYSL